MAISSTSCHIFIFTFELIRGQLWQTDRFMETASIITILGFGFMLGLKHAIEADHLAAVSTIVTQRKNAFTASLWVDFGALATRYHSLQ